jgi:acetyl-CoA carboxylase biotin carboxylase subunit
MNPIRKILVANRGEIALRIMRTCRAMGIATVAVYSDADENSPHTKRADEAVHIGPAPSVDSYLNIERIIDAARRTRSDAIHPGYGFLSENPEFVAACVRAGITFIGPSEESVRRMGLKTEGRRIASDAGVPIIPGYDGSNQTLDALCGAVQEAGFPALIKAVAGGGGRGMRVVTSTDQLPAILASAKREAQNSFGDGSLLIEKYIENARHVEFQIAGDGEGRVVHLFERDCSAQRRYQKIIEESPSPALTEELRRRMGEAAVAVGRAAGYYNAGTVEFVVSPSGEFYFIEVNTRLQVEHPVTEMTTGLDLVKLQIEIAEGRPLPFTQEEIAPVGHSIEARLYAEDPANGFIPAVGKVRDCVYPATVEGLRVDSGIETGTEIRVFYDPLLAKFVAHGIDRETALRKLVYALKNTAVSGVATNRDFLIALLESEEFNKGAVHTRFVEQQIDRLTASAGPQQDIEAAIAAALYLQNGWQSRFERLQHVPPNYRNNPCRAPSIKLELGGRALEVSYSHITGERYLVRCGDEESSVHVLECDSGRIRVAIDGVQRSYRISEAGERLYVHSANTSRVVTRLPRYPLTHAAVEHESMSASMPGQVLKILAAPGDRVTIGEPLMILEAMKIEQTIKSSTSGIIEAVLVKPGDVVAPGEVLVKITAAKPDENV